MKKTTPQPKARPVAKTTGALNVAQEQAVRHGRSPLLIIAGGRHRQDPHAGPSGRPSHREGRSARINATEGGIPSNRAETTAQIDEDLRLFYVALTRARTWLTVTYPRYRSSFQGRWGGWDDVPTLTRFLAGAVRGLFQEAKA
jgi:superfamily I DNA/RNA helicase